MIDNLDEAFPSRYMKASDLPEDGSMSLTIDKVTIEEMGKDQQAKPVIHFIDHDKSFVVNKTNGNTIANVLGSRRFADWKGQQISLGRAEVEAFGEMVEAIRVRSRVRPKKVAGAVKKTMDMSGNRQTEYRFDENK